MNLTFTKIPTDFFVYMHVEDRDPNLMNSKCDEKNYRIFQKIQKEKNES